jgi:hypothetical protein
MRKRCRGCEHTRIGRRLIEFSALKDERNSAVAVPARRSDPRLDRLCEVMPNQRFWFIRPSGVMLMFFVLHFACHEDGFGKGTPPTYKIRIEFRADAVNLAKSLHFDILVSVIMSH